MTPPLPSAIAGRVILAVMAKAPASGQVKTRLIPALGAEGALSLYRALLADKLAQMKLVPGAVPAVLPTVAFTPAGEDAELRQLAGPGVHFIAQRGGDLGERLHNVSADLFAAGAAGVLLIDADTPTLPWRFLAEGAAALASGAVVFGPARDGGYYLIGLREPCAALFAAVDWSTSRVLSQSVARAGESGKEVRLLPAWGDIDEPEDLARLAREVALIPKGAAGYPGHTAAALEALGASGFGLVHGCKSPPRG